MKAISEFTRRLHMPSLMTLGFVAVTAAIGMIGWLVSVGLQKQLDKLASDREENLALLDQTGEMHEGFEKLQQQVAAAKQFVHGERNRLPQSPEETAFLSQFSQLAASVGMEFTDFRPGGVADRGEVKEIELHVRGTGPYGSLCRLLAGLRELPRVVRVSQLAIDAPSEPGGDCSVNMQLYLLFGFHSPQHIGGTQVAVKENP